MVEISEKELPFKLPLSIRPFDKRFIVQRNDGILFADCFFKEYADFICLACNNHFELMDVIEDALRRGIFDEAIMKKFEAALAKGDTNESD